MSETATVEKTAEPKKATLKEVREFFNSDKRPMTLADMKAEWTQGGLSKEEKDLIQIGIGEGTFTY